MIDQGAFPIARSLVYSVFVALSVACAIQTARVGSAVLRYRLALTAVKRYGKKAISKAVMDELIEIESYLSRQTNLEEVPNSIEIRPASRISRSELSALYWQNEYVRIASESLQRPTSGQSMAPKVSMPRASKSNHLSEKSNNLSQFDLCVAAITGKGVAEFSRALNAALSTEPGILQSHDDQGMTLLHWACDRGNKEVVALLLERTGIGLLNVTDVSGMLPVDYAITNDFPEIVDLLNPQE